jgi:hypothetical protein
MMDNNPYVTTYFRRNIKDTMFESFNIGNSCNDGSFNALQCKKKISNDISNISENYFRYSQSNNEVDKMYHKLSDEIEKYNKKRL